jgi:hypothetical protein
MLAKTTLCACLCIWPPLLALATTIYCSVFVSIRIKGLCRNAILGNVCTFATIYHCRSIDNIYSIAKQRSTAQLHVPKCGQDRLYLNRKLANFQLPAETYQHMNGSKMCNFWLSRDPNYSILSTTRSAEPSTKQPLPGLSVYLAALGLLGNCFTSSNIRGCRHALYSSSISTSGIREQRAINDGMAGANLWWRGQNTTIQ